MEHEISVMEAIVSLIGLGLTGAFGAWAGVVKRGVTRVCAGSYFAAEDVTP